MLWEIVANPSSKWLSVNSSKRKTVSIKIIVTVADAIRLLQGKADSLLELPDLEAKLAALPQPPAMGIVSDDEKKLCMLEHLWNDNEIGDVPWKNART